VPVQPDAPLGALGAYWAEPHEATARELEILERLAFATAMVLRAVPAEGGLERLDHLVRRTERSSVRCAR
jgi:hypothetical protein